MAKWEYRTVARPTLAEIEWEIRALAEDDWELVSVACGTDPATAPDASQSVPVWAAFFKRETRGEHLPPALTGLERPGD
jgi:hypothetical protein